LVGIGEDYFPVQLFYGLAQLDKTDGKIVKQHRVTWLAAARSKIVWCLNKYQSQNAIAKCDSP